MSDYQIASIKEVQVFGLSILKEAIAICERHNLTYYLSCGTLIGAVRHQGFIPWDNDIDIELPLPDYRKFLRIAKKELPSHLFVQTYYSDPGVNEIYAKIRANNTTSLPVAWKKLKTHWGIGIDVFPLVGLYNSAFLRKLQLRTHALCRTLLAKDFVLAVNPSELSGNRKLKLLYTIPRWARIGICRLCDRFIFKRMSGSREVALVDWRLAHFKKIEAYEKDAFLPFEDRQYRVPGDSDHVLRMRYGDYMTPPPVEQQNGHFWSHGDIIYSTTTNYTEYQKDL